MKFELSRSAATASLVAAMTTRLFYGLTLDAPEAANAAWLGAPVGLALCLPVVWLLCRISRPTPRGLAALLLAGIALDAAAGIEWTAYSESCLALDHISPMLLMLPLLMAILRCAWLGGDAVGGAARVWIRLFFALMLVVVLYQLPYFNAGWLRPWLGAGAGGVLRSGVRAAGWNALLCAGASAVCAENLRVRDILPGMLLATAVAALLVALKQMMAPVVTAGAVTRAMGVEALLTNGRAPLYLQLPLIVAWFSGMLHLTAFESLAACGLVRRLLPDLKEGPCAAIGLGAVFVLALWRIPRAVAARQALPYLYHALAAAALILWPLRGRKPKCENPA